MLTEKGGWKKREMEKEEIQVSRRRRAREENSRGYKSRAGGVGRLDGGFASRKGGRGLKGSREAGGEGEG